MTETKSKILPCPFCLGEGFTSPNHSSRDEYVVRCTQCSAIAFGRDANDAIKIWNSRPIPESQASKAALGEEDIEKLQAENKKLRDTLKEIENESADDSSDALYMKNIARNAKRIRMKLTNLSLIRKEPTSTTTTTTEHIPYYLQFTFDNEVFKSSLHLMDSKEHVAIRLEAMAEMIRGEG